MAIKKATTTGDMKAPKAITPDEASTHPDGTVPDQLRDEPTLDPALEKARDEEAKALAEVEVTPREDPSIDLALVKARDEEIEKQAARDAEAEKQAAAKAAPAKSDK